MLIALLVALVCCIVGAELPQATCSSSKTVLPHYQPQKDSAWKEYFRYVYGSNDTGESSKRKLNFLYRNTPMEVTTFHWHHKRPLSVLPESWGDTYFHYSNSSYNDGEWAEVNRYSTYFLNSYKDREYVWEEGLSRGFPGRSVNETKVGYGCWFNLAQGSGIFVNVGKTIVVTDKYKSTLFKDLGLTSRGCLPTDTAGGFCFDRYLCTAAQAKGYDSIQVPGHSELVICGGKCATQSLRYTCPPLELRSGVDASRACNCSDESHLLNCGSGPDSVPNLKWNFPASGFPEQKSRRKLCVARKSLSRSTPFNLTVAFTTGAQQGFVPTVKVMSAVKELQEDPSTTAVLLVDVGMAEFSHISAPAHRRSLRGSDRTRSLQATPYGPHDHSHLSVKPPHSARHHHGHDVHYGGGHSHEGHHHHEEPPEHGFGHHHHDHHHDNSPGERGPLREGSHEHNHDEADNQTGSASAEGVGNLSVDGANAELTSQLRATGYHALVTRPSDDAQVVTLPPLGVNATEPLLPGLIGLEGVQVGVLAYPAAAYRAAASDETVIRYIDEANCLREAGAQLVILLAAEADPVEPSLLRRLAGYVDVVLAATTANAVSCDGQWHQTTEEGPVLVQIVSGSTSLGVVRVEGPNAKNLAIQSAIKTIN
jgi:hypothetical protein